MGNRQTFLLAAVLSLAAGVNAGEGPMLVPVKRLSLEVAQRIAEAAVAACDGTGVQAGATVVDRNGIPQVVLRNTLAPPVVLEVSLGKARAAAMFNAPTSSLGAEADSALGRVPGLVLLAGGLPVQVGGHLLGGIGVSGAPSSEEDEACARAGIEAVLEDLEMAE